jgi:hypothetical protein
LIGAPLREFLTGSGECRDRLEGPVVKENLKRENLRREKHVKVKEELIEDGEDKSK